MSLHDVLESNSAEVMRRWQELVQGAIVPEGIGPVELADHLPRFLTEIILALREDAGLSTSGRAASETSTASEHGAQRLRLGFSLEAVVREYGALRHAIVATARHNESEITLRELHVVADQIISGIAKAVTQYTRQRDSELLRQANEHYAFVAHELRNPLSSAKMAFELLKGSGVFPEGSRAVRALERGLASTSELVDQTLQTARIASGIELRRVPMTLATLFKEAEIAALPEAETKGIEVRLRIDGDEPFGADRRLIASALGNLLRNAVKYSHTGAVVAVRGRVSQGRVTVEIEDCCGGLPPGKVEEAFAPFARLQERESGFGLGLAIAKQAVDAHGGNLRVQNLPGKGCIFVLELPTSLP